MYFNKNITNVIRTRTCSLEDFSSKKIDKDTFYKMGFQNLRCIDFNSENLELSGEDSDRKYLLIQMYVNKDINSKFESYFTSQNIYNNPFYLYWFDSIVDVRKKIKPEFYKKLCSLWYMSKFDWLNHDKKHLTGRQK